MERAREVSRARRRAHARAADAGGGDVHVEHEDVLRFAREAGFQHALRGLRDDRGRHGAARGRARQRLAAGQARGEPFYPEGGGQVSDSGLVETPSRARAGGRRLPRSATTRRSRSSRSRARSARARRVRAVVERDTRLATMRNHTATHLLHAALRERLGDHVRQAGSYVGPGQAALRLHPRRAAVAPRSWPTSSGSWPAGSPPTTPCARSRPRATRPSALGAMALFGEKYGDWVRMVEIEGVSRELCGGTHVAATAEIGLFHLTTETSSASNVRRIEAVTGPAARAAVPRAHRAAARARGAAARARARGGARRRAPDRAGEGAARSSRRRRPTAARRTSSSPAPRRSAACGSWSRRWSGAGRRARCSSCPTPCARSSATPRWCSARATDGRVHLVANVAPAVVERGVKAGDVVRAAAQVAGGGGGGRDTMAQAGGRDPEKLPEALATARARDREGARPDGARPRARPRLGALRLRDLRPLAARSPRRCPWWSARTRSAASPRSPRLVEEQGAERVVVGLPLTLAGEEGAPGRARRGRLPSGSSGESRYRWSFTTSASQRGSPSAPGEQGDADSRAAAHLLESYLARAERAPPSEPRTAARPGRPHARGAGGRAPEREARRAAREGRRAPQPPPHGGPPARRPAYRSHRGRRRAVDERDARPSAEPAARVASPCRRKPTATATTGSPRPGGSRTAATAAAADPGGSHRARAARAGSPDRPRRARG